MVNQVRSVGASSMPQGLCCMSKISCHMHLQGTLFIVIHSSGVEGCCCNQESSHAGLRRKVPAILNPVLRDPFNEPGHTRNFKHAALIPAAWRPDTV